MWSQSEVSVVVDDFDTVRFSVFEDETYTPFHVYGNGMLTSAVASEGVEAVGCRDAQVVASAQVIENFAQGFPSTALVTLNLFQGPFCLQRRHNLKAKWMLKQVQHDGRWEISPSWRSISRFGCQHIRSFQQYRGSE
jgi:hypothetical protein